MASFPRRTHDDLMEEIRQAGISDERVLRAFEKVQREFFVPEELVDQANYDIPVPIAEGQVTTQPSLIAKMVEALEIRRGDDVLEVGTGFGYQTAILANLAHRVFSVEHFSDLVVRARANLRESGAEDLGNIELIEGDGTLGVPEYGPFDATVVSAAARHVPRPLIYQLEEGGRLVMPIGPGGDEQVTLFKKIGGILTRQKVLIVASFVPLEGAYVDQYRSAA